jgi:hypothetical protein
MAIVGLLSACVLLYDEKRGAVKRYLADFTPIYLARREKL